MIHTTTSGVGLAAAAAVGIGISVTNSARAHPHVFIDGGVDFVVDDQGALSALAVTWRYDVLETLYVFSTLGEFPDRDGRLPLSLQARLIKNETDWPDDFEGAAHLNVEGEAIELSQPTSVEVTLDGDRLVLHFLRYLAESVPLEGRRAEVAFYEATYYYAFAITDPPQFVGLANACEARVKPFDPSAQLAALQATLLALGREETPEIDDIGSLFADRVFVTCGETGG